MRYFHIDQITCPHCGDKHARLEAYTKAFERRTIANIYQDESIGGGVTYEVESYPKESYGYELDEWVCSECDHVIAKTDDELIKFLIDKGYITPTERANTVNKIKEIP